MDPAPNPDQPSAVSSNLNEASSANTKSGETNQFQFPNVQIPEINLPSGGGAIQGIGEKFQANAITGTGSLSVPLAISPSPRGQTPSLAMQYDSGAGNSAYGLGWYIGLPSISRKTNKGLPQYRDEEEGDTFILSGAEDLVPFLSPATNDQWELSKTEKRLNGATYRVFDYRPRQEGLFGRIQRWEHQISGISHWQVTTQDNITSIYGKGDPSPSNPQSNLSKIVDPKDERKIFQWFLERSFDDRGNVTIYEYKSEDKSNIEASVAPYEIDRPTSCQVYLKRVRYGNTLPYFRGGKDLLPPDWENWQKNKTWLFELVFDYGEHLQGGSLAKDEIPTYQEQKKWPLRPDCFSTFRPGFELRTYRLCRGMHLFHHLKADGSSLDTGQDPVLTKSTCISTNFNPVASQIEQISHCFFRSGQRADLPPITLEYTKAEVDDKLQRLDEESLKNLPQGLQDNNYRWVDLYGEGISGVLTSVNGGWYYKPNLGNGQLGSKQAVKTIPSLATNGIPATLNDIDGDGCLNLIVRSNGFEGFFEMNESDSWDNFRPFKKNPQIDWNDPNMRLLDLTGDGLADILLTEDDCLLWHQSQGESGYDPALRINKSLDEQSGPRIVFNEALQTIFLADMTGDGLSDIVRIRNGEVCYWANCGYGRFNHKIVMADAPRFDVSDYFDPARLRLADIDGSGTTDLLYLGRGIVHFWLNQSGNSWSASKAIQHFPLVDDLNNVQVLDFLGKGTACLVWSSALPMDVGNPLRYIDLMVQKPYLLSSYDNNMGEISKMRYLPSTFFYLQDEKKGYQWATKLPFPVQVLERVEIYDAISQNLFVAKYAYHEGYYDGVEREFRGFGMVEQWDTEDFASLQKDSLFHFDELPHNWQVSTKEEGTQVADSIPIYTKSWYHTGYFRRGQALSQHFQKQYYSGDEEAWSLGPPALPNKISGEEVRQAARALKGSLLRQEVYGLDGAQEEGHPYLVTENKPQVELIQSKGPNEYAVFRTDPCEALSYHYERNPEDPRISHELTLAVDDFGNVTHAASIVYPRRKNAVAAEQEKLFASLQENLYTHQIEPNPLQTDVEAYRHSLPLENRSFEILGLKPKYEEDQSRIDKNWLLFKLLGNDDSIDLDTVLDYTQIQSLDNVKLRLLSRNRMKYFANSLDKALPFGQIESLAIPYETYTLTYTQPILDQMELGSKITPAILQEAEFLKGNDLFPDGKATEWWHQPGRSIFDPARDHDRFYLPEKMQDALGNIYQSKYDRHYLFAEEMEDPLNNSTKASYDYLYLQPFQLTDSNGVVTQLAFDLRSMVVASAIIGKNGEGDELKDHHIITVGLEDHTDYIKAISEQPLSFLGRCSAYFFYDPFAFLRAKAANQPAVAPVFSLDLKRERHYDQGNGANSATQIAISYSDGLGRVILAKGQAEDGLAPKYSLKGNLVLQNGKAELGHSTNRWVGNGRTVFNNKGNPVLQYEPFFDSHPYFTQEEALVKIGVSPVLHYDPLGRVIRTDRPDGTFSTISFTPWMQSSSDPNDNVRNSSWYQDRGAPDPNVYRASFSSKEERAAYLAAQHANTPTVQHLDSLGRPFVSIAHNRTVRPDHENRQLLVTEEYIPVRTEWNFEGQPLEIRDSRRITLTNDPINYRGGNSVITYTYTMNGLRLYQHSMDAGRRWQIPDVMGKVLYAWDDKENVFQTTYDVLQRPTHQWITDNSGNRLLVERLFYGEQLNGDYFKGNLYLQFDGAGMNKVAAYDFKGNSLQSERRLVQIDYSQLKAKNNWTEIVPNWDALAAQNMDVNQAENTVQPQLEAPFNAAARYDALNRPFKTVSPDGSAHYLLFNKAGLWDMVRLDLQGQIGLNPSEETPTALRSNNQLKTYVENINYDAKGQRSKIVYGNASTSQYTYDEKTFRLIKLISTRPDPGDGNTLLQDIQYIYDPIGNITEVFDDSIEKTYFKGKGVEGGSQYRYDSLYRLIEAGGREQMGNNRPGSSGPGVHYFQNVPFSNLTLQKYTQKYQYDTVGNILEVRHIAHGNSAFSWTREYNYQLPPTDTVPNPGPSLNNRLYSHKFRNDPETERKHLSYDSHGNMLKMGHLQVMHWDFRDQLMLARNSSEDVLCNFYDSARERVRKIYFVGNEIKERIYLGNYEIYQRKSTDGTRVIEEIHSLHIQDNTQRICLIETRTKAPQPIAPEERQHIRFQLNNHLGSACVELNEQAAIIGYEEYRPFGTTSYITQHSGLEKNPRRYRFSGKEKDEGTGLYYYGARYYAAWLGRWCSADPAGLVDGGNLYGFVKNNPIVFDDNIGLQSRYPNVGGSGANHWVNPSRNHSEWQGSQRYGGYQWLQPGTEEDQRVFSKGFEHVSFELQDTPKGYGLGARDRVSLWLKNHSTLIRDTAEKWSIDPRAIAGAIAWEALENFSKGPFLYPPWLAKIVSGSVGPGKFHGKESLFAGEGFGIAKQLEAIGWLPERTLEERFEILSTPEGAIEYIAAAMSAIATQTEQIRGDYIRDRPDILATVYQRLGLIGWQDKLMNKPEDEPYGPGGMGVWINENMAFLEAAVGEGMNTSIPSTREVPVFQEFAPESSFEQFLRDARYALEVLERPTPEGLNWLFGLQ